MTKQRIRKLLLTTSLLLFPITLYYFSPALIINAGLNGITHTSHTKNDHINVNYAASGI